MNKASSCLSACRVLVLVFCFFLPATAQEMRTFTPIRSRTAQSSLPEGVREIQPAQPLPAGTLAQTLEALSESWNTPEFMKFVSEKFYGAARLGDNMNTSTAKDARLQIVGVRNPAILQQVVKEDAEGGRLRVSTISVIVESLTEYNDPRHGFISAPGTNELVMDIIEKMD